MCEINTHLSPGRFFKVSTSLPSFQKMAQESAAAAYKHECLFHRPIALSLRVSLTLGMAGGRGSPRRATCRMSVYFTDTGNNNNNNSNSIIIIIITITITITITIAIIVIVIAVAIVIVIVIVIILLWRSSQGRARSAPQKHTDTPSGIAILSLLPYTSQPTKRNIGYFDSAGSFSRHQKV